MRQHSNIPPAARLFVTLTLLVLTGVASLAEHYLQLSWQAVFIGGTLYHLGVLFLQGVFHVSK